MKFPRHPKHRHGDTTGHREGNDPSPGHAHDSSEHTQRSGHGRHPSPFAASGLIAADDLASGKAPSPEQATQALSNIMVFLRVSLHLVFAFLLGFAVVQNVAAGTASWGQITGACLLACVYLVGTVWENRKAHSVLVDFTLDSTTRLLATGWLCVVLLLWVCLVASSMSFVWLLFPLVFLILHVLPTTASIVTVCAAWAVAAFLPALVHHPGWNVANVVGPFIGTFFAIGVYFTYRVLGREVHAHALLTQQLISAQQQLAMSEHQAGRMEERERLSREIHDTVAQGLSSIVLVSRAARANLRKGNLAELSAQLDTISEQAGDSLAEARRFVRDLASPDLSQSLPVALERVVARVRARQEALSDDLEVVLTIIDETNGANGAAQLPEPVTRTVVRVVQEALANVVKHADASKVVVTAGLWDEQVTIDVVDNGRGFDPDASRSGFGIDGIQARVSDLGGTVTIESCTGAGTTLTCAIPLTSRTRHEESQS